MLVSMTATQLMDALQADMTGLQQQQFGGVLASLAASQSYGPHTSIVTLWGIVFPPNSHASTTNLQREMCAIYSQYQVLMGVVPPSTPQLFRKIGNRLCLQSDYDDNQLNQQLKPYEFTSIKEMNRTTTSFFHLCPLKIIESQITNNSCCVCLTFPYRQSIQKKRHAARRGEAYLAQLESFYHFRTSLSLRRISVQARRRKKNQAWTEDS